MSATDLDGRTIAGKYLVEKKLGSGGMGVVHRARHLSLNRLVAIKFIHGELGTNPDIVERFKREAQHASRVVHANVVTIFDFGSDDGVLYLVMEFLPGQSLDGLIRGEGPFSIERAVDLTRQIARGLGAAHDEGIVHRDLKPSNVFVHRLADGREHAKVLDFGLAKVFAEGGESGITRTGMVVGTPRYMSPEHLGGQVTPASDIYSLGLILYEMLCGAGPFTATSVNALMQAQLFEPPPRPSARVPGTALPPAIEDAVMRCLAKPPESRYPNTRELLDALDAAVGRARDRQPVEQRAGADPDGTSTRIIPRGASTVAAPDAPAAPAVAKDKAELVTSRRQVIHALSRPFIGRRNQVASAAGVLLFAAGAMLWQGWGTGEGKGPQVAAKIPAQEVVGSQGKTGDGSSSDRTKSGELSRREKKTLDKTTTVPPPPLRTGPPTVMVLIAEQTVSPESYDKYFSGLTHAETVMFKALTDRGLRCVDPAIAKQAVARDVAIQALEGNNEAAGRLANQASADLVIIGNAVAVNQGNVRESRFVSSAGNVTIRLVTASGRVVTADSERATAAQLDPVTAGGIAIEEATARLAEKMVAAVEAFGKPSVSEVELLITGLTSFSELQTLERDLASRVGSDAVLSRNFSGNVARLALNAARDAPRLAQELDGARIGSMTLRVTSVSGNRIDLRVVR